MRSHRRWFAIALGVTLAGCTSTAPGESAQAVEPTPTPSESFGRANVEVLSFTGAFETSGDLVAVNPETGGVRVLVEDLDVLSAAWSANGRWVAYEASRANGTGLWVMSASQEPRLVATDASILAWSSSGAQLATIRLASTPDGPSYYSRATLGTIDPVTGESTDVGTIPDDVFSEPAWSPDGTRFVFGARGGALYSLDVRSGGLSLLVRLPVGWVDQIVWSPDGAHISVNSEGPLYVVDADGSNARLLLDDAAGTPAWSPDGTRLAYAEYRFMSGTRINLDGSGVIWVAPMDGTAPTEIGSPLPATSHEGDDLFFNDSSLVWSSDGSRVAVREWQAFGKHGQVVDVSAIDADGQGQAERIDELTYLSWDGGRYSCEC